MAASAPHFDQWLSSETVDATSKTLADPPGFSRTRRDSYSRFLSLPIEPNPLYRGYGYFTGVDLAGLEPNVHGPAVPLPPAVPGAVRVVHDASGTRVELPDPLHEAGVRVHPLADLWARGEESVAQLFRGSEEATDKLSALATAVVNRAYRLEIPDGFAEPVRVQDIAVLSQPHEAISVRRSLRAGDRSQVIVTEEAFAAPNGQAGQRLYASSTDLDLGAYAKVVYLGVHAPDLSTVSIYRRRATVGDNGRVAWIWNGLGGYRTKMRNLTFLAGTRSTADDLQTFFGTGNQSYDSSVDITHTATDTHGQSITRGVFADEARGMSRGLVRIEHEARKTVSFISEHAMLLSRGARSDTIPILEILCRDVKATHSTSVAPVDPEKVFYLESRGVPEPDAVRMIGEGFLSHVLERAPIGGLRERIYPLLAARWDRQDIRWRAEEAPALPALEVAGTDAAPDWRFDAKLR